MKRTGITIIIYLAVFLVSPGQGNDALNKVDNNGLKQGKWIKKFENGNTLYEGLFLDDKPIGEFKRYYIGGNPISVLNYHLNSDSIDAVFYHPNGFLAAKGLYMGKMKEGIWRFFSSKVDSCVICIENYSNNLKEGKSTKYHTNGNLAEELTYSANKRNGKWLQYYTDGVICIRSAYRNDSINGLFETFFTNGNKEITGSYNNNARHGNWIFYNEDGTLKREIIYHYGKAENEAELIEEETKYLDLLEKNGGKIQDPAKTGFLR